MEVRRVAASRTAAWVWGAAVDPGTPCTAFLPHTAAVAHPAGGLQARIRTRVMRLLPADIGRTGGILVTTPLRTAVDLLCDPEERSPRGTILGLIRLAGLDGAGLAAELRGRSRLAGRGRGLRRLQVLVTR